jgi:hypothetical protein
MTLMRRLGEPVATKETSNRVKLPLGERRYLEFNKLTRQEVISVFQNAKMLPG